MAAIGTECTSQSFNDLLVLSKSESTYSDDASPTAATDAVLAIKPTVTIQGTDLKREIDKPYWGNDPIMLIDRFVQLEFECEVSGAGVGNLPGVATLMRQCANVETQVTTTGAEQTDYTPGQAAIESASNYFYHGNDLWKLIGCRGNWGVSFAVGQWYKFKFTLLGLFQLPADNATIPTPTYTGFNNPLPVNYVNTPVASIHSLTAGVRECTFDAGLDVKGIDIPGCKQIKIVNRSPSASMTIMAPRLSAKNFYAIADAATTGAVLIQHGVDDGDIFEFSMPQSQIKLSGLQTSDVDGEKALKIDINPLPANGNDEYVATWK